MPTSHRGDRSTSRKVTAREDIYSNPRMFLMCVFVPLSLTLGCAVIAGRGDVSWTEWPLLAVGFVGGLITAGSYLLRYSDIVDAGGRVGRLARMASWLWLVWLSALGLAWLVHI